MKREQEAINAGVGGVGAGGLAAAFRGPWLCAALLPLLATIVYWPTLGNGFVSDDKYHVVNNVSLRSLGGLYDIWFKLGTIQLYFPLTHSAFWAQFQLWGLDPRGYHVVNWLLHGIGSVLVWRLLLRLEVRGAWLAAAVFAVHPVHVESVAWASELKNILSSDLALVSQLAYWRFSPPCRAEQPGHEAPRGQARWSWYALALTFYVAALLCKSVTVSVPAVLLVIDWWKRGRIERRDVAALVPFFVAGLALAVLTIWMEKTFVGASGQEFELSAIARVLIAGRALWFYVGKLVWPAPLVFYYPRWTMDAGVWWQYLFPAAALLALAGLWVARARIGRGPLAAVLIFAGVLVPALGFINVYPFRFSFVSDHYQYHASIALIALAAAGAAWLGDRLAQTRPALVPVTASLLVLVLVVVSLEQVPVYRDAVTLNADIVEHNPDCWAAHHNLGVAFQSLEQYDLALTYFDRAIEIFGRLATANPRIGSYRNDQAADLVNVGFLQRKLGRVAESDSAFRRAIATRETLVRDFPSASEYQEGLARCYVNLAIARQMSGDAADAAAWHRKAIAARERLVRECPTVARHADGLATSYGDLGQALCDAGRRSESEATLRQAIELRERLVLENPAEADFRERLAWSHGQLAQELLRDGRPSEAEAAHRQALAIREQLVRDNPGVSKYRYQVALSSVDIGLAQRETGRQAAAADSISQAQTICEQLVRDYPTVSEYRESLVWCQSHREPQDR